MISGYAKRLNFWLSALTICLSVSAQTNARSVDDKEGTSPSHRELTPEMQQQIAAVQGIATDVVAYRNVSLFAGTKSDDLVSNMTIVVAGDRIQAVVKSEQDSDVVTDDATVVDAGNWYAIPGLVDTHVHLATLPARVPAEATLKRYLFGGITTVRDMAGDTRALADLSRASLINEIPAPDIKYAALMAGPGFFADPRTIMSGLGTKAGQTPWMQGIDENTDIELAVAQARGTWASGIKIYANLSGNLVRAIIEEGRRQGIPVWTHVEVYPATIFDAVGATSVSHVCMIPESLMRPEGAKPRTPESIVDLSNFDVESDDFRRYAAELKASGTVLDATALISRQAADEAKRAKEAGEDTGLAKRPVCDFDAVVEPVLSALHTAGVPISVGTDVSSSPDDPFPAIFEEIETLEDVTAMSRADVLRAATVHGAMTLGLADEIGTLEPGKFANIVFLEENPLKDLAHLRSVTLTVKRGHPFYRADYAHEPIPVLPFPGRPKEPVDRKATSEVVN